VLQRPVIDQTGIAGIYNLELEWGSDRIAGVTNTLRDRFGLTLTPERRDMESLIIDEIRRDPSMVLLAQAGTATAWAPLAVREQITRLLTIR
jgi:Protein of unknown function (DUF3738)